MTASYRFGIEEEYFLADATTRGTPGPTVAGFHAAVRDRLPEAERELLQSQVEVASPPSTDFAEARGVLSGLRRGLADIGREHGVLVLAAGTHPLAQWSSQDHTEAERYEGLMRDLRMLGRRNVVCGMHVHVEVPRPEARIDLMNRLMPFMPLLLGLSASSPFWQGQETGLAAYRLSVFGEMPRTGLPDLFHDAEDYARYVEIMTRAGAIKDASFLWWTLRPSIKFPTLELRVADACTRLEDTIAIAALYRCLVRCADRRPELNRGMTGTSRALVAENLWRAQRDGARAMLIDEAKGEAVPFADALDTLLALVAEDAEALGCAPDISALRRIASEGTSADRQATVFARARQGGASEREALGAVVDWLARTTRGEEKVGE
ncbi:carboxylate-amine ligase [Pseudoroseomonas wenyumeiae]|uniref:Putative glutamate--cysteine ligase 2 n=1 Tax=Teichococcus wenyumeiae TaxID=2478470 RepID=A0A3A9J693_9PROT|nr:carboxylate-amine ligase [Pseudoroseomonas wenyumeiae]RKK02747.1 carboxylate-amine ligase [Pseudoroseomonas wenyumeiae]RMI25218.1 carboxylate-amine ligase [Pseudoroseomonas wenyumeiae]